MEEELDIALDFAELSLQGHAEENAESSDDEEAMEIQGEAEEMEVQEEAEEIEIQPRAPVAEKEKVQASILSFLRENEFEVS